MSTDTINLLYERMNNRNYNGFPEMFTENYVAHKVGHPDTFGYKAGVEDWLVSFLENFPSVKFNVIKVAGDGDTVFVYYKVTGLPGSQEAMAVDIYRFEGSKIAELWDIQQVLPEGSTPSQQPPDDTPN